MQFVYITILNNLIPLTLIFRNSRTFVEVLGINVLDLNLILENNLNSIHDGI